MDNSQRLQAEKTVSLTVLLDPQFIQEHTDLNDISEIFALAGQDEVSEESLDKISDAVWQEILVKHSKFSSWEDMFTAASQRFVRSRLLEGIDVPEGL
ncbi:hypothetical protein [Cohaesibacter celericrescens]